MVEDCIFCKIAKNEERASWIYKDKDTMAFLDARPINEGHSLVISRKHYENIFEIPNEELANLFKIVKKVAYAIVRSEKAEGIRIVQNNGSAAEQMIFHFHVHVIPEHEKQSSHKPREPVGQDRLQVIAARIRKFMAAPF